MQNISFAMIFDYINRLAVIYFICVIGGLVKTIFESMNKNTTVDALKVFLSSIFTSITICALIQYLNTDNIALCILICFFVGMWSPKILSLAVDGEFVKKFTLALFKKSKNTLTESISDAIKDMEKEKEENKDDNTT